MATALHLHGWSNHGAHSRVASIAWHTQQNAAAGVELLWWTDHANTLLGRVPDLRVTPAAPTAVARGVWTIGKWGLTGQARVFLRSPTAPLVDSLGDG